jgi:hypothetical protein
MRLPHVDRLFLFLVTFACLPLRVVAASIEGIVASPGALDGKTIEVSGRIEYMREKTSHAGNKFHNEIDTNQASI